MSTPTHDPPTRSEAHEGTRVFAPVAEAARGAMLGRLERLRGRVQRLLWVETLALAGIGLVVVVAAAMLVDWWWRPAATVTRVALTVVAVTGLALVAMGTSRRILQRRVTPAAIARRLEQIDPRLGDRISSAVALAESDPGSTAGVSPELRGEALVQGAALLEVAQPERQIDRRPALRMFAVALAVVAVAVSSIVLKPEASRLAARRLTNPVGADQWPRRHVLALENVPERMHAGDSVEVFVRDQRGVLPEDTEIQFRTADGSVVVPPLTLSGETASARWESVREDFAVRAHGGDDNTMPWHSVTVLPAPRIEEFVVQLKFPEYSQREPVEAFETELSVLAGTVMRLEATVAPPVVEATFMRIGQSGAGDSSPESVAAGADGRWPVRIEAEGTRLEVGPMPLEDSATYGFEWVDRHGLRTHSDRRWEIRVTRDEAPRVDLVAPESDTEITPRVVLPMRMRTTDDLGLQETWFEVRHVQRALSDRVNEVRLDERPLRYTAEESFAPGDWLASRGDTGAGTVALEAGDTLELTAVAVDVAGHRGQSTTRRLRVVTEESLRGLLAETERETLENLRQAADEQRVALEQTRAARSRLSQEESQRRAARDRLQAAESVQGSVQRRIEDSSRGVRERLTRAIERAEQNQIPADALRSLDQRIEDTIAPPVATADAALDRAARVLGEQDLAAAEQTLTDAVTAQEQALASLDRMVAEMRAGDARREITDQLAEMAATQRRLEEATARMDEAADVAQEGERLATEQRELARQADEVAERLRSMAQDEQAQEPELAAQAQSAAEALQSGERRASDTMRRAAGEVARARSGRANEMQRQAVDQLEQARRQLSGSGLNSQPSADTGARDDADSGDESDAAAAAVAVAQLAARQQSLVTELVQSPTADQAAVQTEIAEETRTVAADQGLPPGFSDALEDAARDMDRAAALLRRSSTEDQAVGSAERALERLEFIRESLARGDSDPGEREGGQQGAADAPPDAQPPPPVPLASLKLVRATQEFLRQRTAELAEQERQGVDSAVERARLQAARQTLAEEQARLVERIERYAREMNAAAAEPSPQETESDAP